MLKLDKTPLKEWLKKTFCIMQENTSGKTVGLMTLCICIVRGLLIRKWSCGECSPLPTFTGLSLKGCYKFPEESSTG